MSSSIFASVEMAPRDPILGLTEAFNADTRATKVNLGVGVYYDDNGKIPLLAAVKAAEKARLETMPPRGYQPMRASTPTTRPCRTCSSVPVPSCWPPAASSPPKPWVAPAP